MRKLMVLEMVTLDGVMQAPGGREEDQRGGFTHGGWSAPYNDSVKMQIMGEGMSRGADLLFGRWTYEKMYNVWHGRTDNPFTAVFERSQKYVASRTLKGPLPWVNSTLLEGDAADAVAELKQDPGLDHLQAWVEDSGEGRWTVEESINTAVPAPVIGLSLMMRFRSRQDNSFGARMLAAMRQQFGGHAVKPK